MTIGLILLAALAANLNTVQRESNATLDRPVWTAVCVFAVALATALVIALVSGQRVPSSDALARVPW